MSKSSARREVGSIGRRCFLSYVTTQTVSFFLRGAHLRFGFSAAGAACAAASALTGSAVFSALAAGFFAAVLRVIFAGFSAFSAGSAFTACSAAAA